MGALVLVEATMQSSIEQQQTEKERWANLRIAEKKRYTPAGVTPVHLLIEAETSSAFLREARV